MTSTIQSSIPGELSGGVGGGVSDEAVALAVADLIALLGADAVLHSAADLLQFRDPYGHPDSDSHDAGAAVLPTTTEQVQGIVRIANRYGVPLWTFGQGHNVTYGGPAPRVRGSILVNLRNMNQVLEINPELAYVVVEPGVSWYDLHDALEAEGSGLWTSLSDLGWGSVVGNSLENGVGYTPYGDHASAVCGLEVVLPDGSLLRTGMGAMTGNEAWHTYPHNFGPSFDGLFQQSNLGIVTRMGFWVLPRPETYAACTIALQGYDTFAAVVDSLRGLLLDRTIEGQPLFMSGFTLDEDGVRQLAAPGTDTWVCYFSLYGRAALVDLQYEAVRDTVTAIEGVRTFRRTFDGHDQTGMANHYERVQRGIPDMDMLNPALLPFGEFTGHLDFSPVVPAVGRVVVETEQLIRSIYQDHGHPCRTALILRPRNALQISSTFFDTRDEARVASAYAGYADLVTEVVRRGHCVPYRTNLQHMDLVADQFDFGDHAQLRLAERIKAALDPNGVLSPGKSGIWPPVRAAV